jgi:hypothetical protein
MCFNDPFKAWKVSSGEKKREKVRCRRMEAERAVAKAPWVKMRPGRNEDKA